MNERQRQITKGQFLSSCKKAPDKFVVLNNFCINEKLLDKKFVKKKTTQLLHFFFSFSSVCAQ